MSLIGFYLTCTVTFKSFNPAIKREVEIKAEGIKCLMVEDRLGPVGSPEYIRHPYIIDCSEAIMWLKPTNAPGGIFTLDKEDKECEL